MILNRTEIHIWVCAGRMGIQKSSACVITKNNYDIIKNKYSINHMKSLVELGENTVGDGL